MLARISRGTASVLGLSFTRDSPRRPPHSVSVTEDAEEVIIDLDILLLPVHDFLAPWSRYAGQCKQTIVPVYHSIQSLLRDDVERIEQLLLSLENSGEDQDFDCEASPCSMNLGSGIQSSFPELERPPYRQPFHPYRNEPNPAIPTIVVTLCDPQPRETSALLPLQDSAFNSRLTVPGHPKLNSYFPPMAVNVPSIYMLSDLNWSWKNGHWQVLLPEVAEQTKKRMFSRVISRRRAPRRSRTPITFTPLER